MLNPDLLGGWYMYFDGDRGVSVFINFWGGVTIDTNYRFSSIFPSVYDSSVGNPTFEYAFLPSLFFQL